MTLPFSLRVFFFTSLMLVIDTAFSQSTSPMSKKDKQRFEEARSEHKRKNVEDALKQYCKLLNKYEGHPELELWTGLAYKDKGKPKQALGHLVKATKNNTSTNAPLYSTIGELYRNEKEFRTAQKYYALFLEHTDPSSKNYAKGQRLYDQMQFAAQLVDNPLDVNPVPLDNRINTLSSEYLPQFTADGSMMYFTRRISGQEDIFYTTKEEGEIEVVPFDHINTPNNEGAHTISADGTRFIFTHCSDKVGYGGCDLYVMERINGEWRKPKNMGKRINSLHWESQPSLSGDGNVLYFSSSREVGQGGRDIWYSVFDTSGFWSAPVNAGIEVNTSQDESSPFIHADLKTLYFRSNGHLGMGSFDLFLSRQDSTKQWKNIKNLGYPINTIGDEGALTVSLDGTKAYFASDFDGTSKRNNLDIYQIDLPQQIRPEPCTFVKIKTIDEDDNMPIRSIVEVIDAQSGEIISRKKGNLNGQVLLPIPIKTTMMINVVADDYVFYSDNITLDSITHGLAPYDKKIKLTPIAQEVVNNDVEEKRFVMRNIFFESGRATLLPISMNEIRRLYDILIENKEYHILIIGHTDNVGSEDDNMKLSEERAQAVRASLIDLGVAPQRILTKGEGESNPIAENESEEGRRQNRRTEFILQRP